MKVTVSSSSDSLRWQLAEITSRLTALEESHDQPELAKAPRRGTSEPSVVASQDHYLSEADRTTIIWQAIAALPEDERPYFTTHAHRLAMTLGYVPFGTKSMAALEVGSSGIVLPILAHRLRYGVVRGTVQQASTPSGLIERQFACEGGTETYLCSNGDLEADPLAFPGDGFDLVLCCEVIEHMSRDPMHLLAEVNRVLKPGGLLVLTTPNVTSFSGLSALLHGYMPYLYASYCRSGSLDRHHIEYSPHEVMALLRSAGFEVRTLTTHDSWSSPDPRVVELVEANGYPTWLRGDNIVALGIKAGPVTDRYPAIIYE